MTPSFRALGGPMPSPALRSLVVALSTLVLATGVPAMTGTAHATCAVPGAPTAVVATPGNASASVSWTAPASDGGCAITGYTVTATPDGANATTGGMSATVSGLTNGSPY